MIGYESLAGQSADAIEHLRQAIDPSERLRSFKALVGEEER